MLMLRHDAILRATNCIRSIPLEQRPPYVSKTMGVKSIPRFANSSLYFFSLTHSEYFSAEKVDSRAAPFKNEGWSGQVTAKSTASGLVPVATIRISLRVLVSRTTCVSLSG